MTVEGIKEIRREFQMFAFRQAETLRERNLLRGVAARTEVREHCNIAQGERRRGSESIDVQIWGGLPGDVVAATDPVPEGLARNPQRLKICDTRDACLGGHRNHGASLVGVDAGYGPVTYQLSDNPPLIKVSLAKPQG